MSMSTDMYKLHIRAVAKNFICIYSIIMRPIISGTECNTARLNRLDTDFEL